MMAKKDTGKHYERQHYYAESLFNTVILGTHVFSHKSNPQAGEAHKWVRFIASEVIMLQ